MALALMFSGFSAAAHTVKDVRNVVSSDVQSDSSTVDMSADHSKQDDNKADKKICADCLNNCSHMVFLTDHTIQLPEFSSAHHMMEVSNSVPDAHILSLLRPPRTLA